MNLSWFLEKLSLGQDKAKVADDLNDILIAVLKRQEIGDGPPSAAAEEWEARGPGPGPATTASEAGSGATARPGGRAAGAGGSRGHGAGAGPARQTATDFTSEVRI